MGTQIPHLPEIERVSTSVIRILGGNPGKFTLQGTNTYLISPPNPHQRPHFLLLDTGQGSEFPSWRRSLQQVLASESARLRNKVRITQCVLTHWHHDHVGGIIELRQVCAEDHDAGGTDGKAAEEEERVKICKYPLFDPSPSPSSQTSREGPAADQSQGRERETQLLRSANSNQDVGPIHLLRDAQILHVGNPDSPDEETLKLQVLHTPGHTSDHIALMIISSPADPSEVGSIFTGDAVLGHGTAVFENLGLYMRSLGKMRGWVEKVAVSESGSKGENGKVTAFPAHGAVIQDAKGKIEEYISHRAMREREVLEVLTGNSAGDQDQVEKVKNENNGWTLMQIVKIVYKDVPESLHIAAQGGVVQVLAKLEGEGRVEKMKDGRRWRIVRGARQGAMEDEGMGGKEKSAL